ncbi:DUF2490 domain-containing protein [Parabacteroides sp. Marseille-P3160]|uniref:DUF2490 domain-containing protein n=1 Tax=Parabacteroides sp. Marseille-P3160 TaxID=1917887 RepID=UPI00135CB061|nr:DUF2490 domain-containing protein [Parabacteroides sp. Marseille-P3160]
MKKKSVYILSMLVLFHVPRVIAQTETFGLWSSIEASKKLNRFDLNSELELRTMEGVEKIARISAKVGVDYRMIKPLKVGIAYQYIHFNDVKYSDFQPRNRFIAYLQGKQKWGNWEFTLRERLQTTIKDESDRLKESGKTDTYKMNPEWTWRNRLRISYNIPKCKITPSFSIETFYQLNNPDGNTFDRLRYTLSGTYKINKQNAIELYGLYQRNINTDEPENRSAIGVSYSFSF